MQIIIPSTPNTKCCLWATKELIKRFFPIFPKSHSCLCPTLSKLSSRILVISVFVNYCKTRFLDIKQLTNVSQSSSCESQATSPGPPPCRRSPSSPQRWCWTLSTGQWRLVLLLCQSLTRISWCPRCTCCTPSRSQPRSICWPRSWLGPRQSPSCSWRLIYRRGSVSGCCKCKIFNWKKE